MIDLSSIATQHIQDHLVVPWNEHGIVQYSQVPPAYFILPWEDGILSPSILINFLLTCYLGLQPSQARLLILQEQYLSLSILKLLQDLLNVHSSHISIVCSNIYFRYTFRSMYNSLKQINHVSFDHMMQTHMQQQREVNVFSF